MPPTIAGFLGQKSILRQLVLAANTQAAWGAPVAQAALIEAIRFDVGSFVKIQRTKESTYGQAGALNSFASDQWTTANKVSLDISGYLTDWMAGWLFALIMGKEVVTGGAAPFSHTFNWLDQSVVAWPTTLYAKDTNDLAYQLVDMGISTMTISSTATGAMKYKATLLGTGVTVPGILGGMPNPVARQNIYGNNLQVSIGPAAGALENFYPRVMMFELTLDAGMDQVFASGGGYYAGYLSTAMPKVKLKMSLAASATDDIFAWKNADTLMQLTANATSGAAELNIAMPNWKFDENTSLTNSNGEAVWDVNLSETDILQIGLTPLITVGVVNSQASYLTAA